jgi:Phage integrase family
VAAVLLTVAGFGDYVLAGPGTGLSGVELWDWLHVLLFPVVIVFDGDLPLRDAPLPGFLDDGAFTKLLQATRADPDPFVRLAVEFLARTGLRKGEFLDLTVDVEDHVVQIGAAYWLHVPVGKLRSDRYIPLHPQLKDLLDIWLAQRPTSLRSPYLFIEHGQGIGEGRVDRALAKVAQVAGIGHVSPHRLRHTLATQAEMSDVARTASFGMVRDQETIRVFELAPWAERFNEASQLRQTIHHLSYTSCNSASSERVAPGATLRPLVPGRTGGPQWQGWPARRRWCSWTGLRRCGPSPRSLTPWSKAGAASIRPGV